MRYLLLRLKRFCGFITGFVFFLSGIFKLMDPVGTGLIMEEYFRFLHIGFLIPAAKVSGTLIAFVETVLGAGLISGVWRRAIAPAALALQGVFTLITLLLLIFNPDMDCGCFGEVIHLTHAQTFLKNIILTVLLLTYYIPARHLGETRKRKYVSFAIVTISTAVFTIYSWTHIPLIDYTEFKPAAALQAGSRFATPHEDIYESVFIYEKDGVRQEFTLGHLPDSTWTFISTETVMKEGHEPMTATLSFYDADGAYRDSLASQGKVMVISYYDTDIKDSRWERTERFMTTARSAGFTPLLLVAGTYESIPESLKDNAFISDRKNLMTMNRSNGGVTFFSDGYLIRKWAAGSQPDKAEIEELLQGDTTETIIGQDTQGRLTFQGFLLYVFAVMLLL